MTQSTQVAQIDDRTGAVINIYANPSQATDAQGFTLIHSRDWAAGNIGNIFVNMVWTNAPERPAIFDWPEAVDVTGDLALLSVAELRDALAAATAAQEEALQRSRDIQAALAANLQG
jgi:hypothetical protein